MAPDRNISSLPYNLKAAEEDIVMSDTHTFPVADYVVIHQCDPPCDDCEFIKVSNKEALKLSLKEEKQKNEKYRERLNDILKKYGQSLRQIEFQKSRIELLKRQLNKMEHKESSLDEFKVVSNDDYTVIEPSLDSLEEDDDLVIFKQQPRLELLTE